MRLGLYIRLPEKRTGRDVTDIKAALRATLKEQGAKDCTIFRNPLPAVGHYYRFIRINFTKEA